MVLVAAVVALGVVFGKSLLEGGSSLNSDSQTKQVSKPSDSLTANDVPANRALVPAAGIAVYELMERKALTEPFSISNFSAPVLVASLSYGSGLSGRTP
jgi:hypothetical protein